MIALLIVDPTMASPKNAKVSRYADIVINSLTKYANWEGDVMMGSAVFPSFSPLGLEVREYIKTPPRHFRKISKEWLNRFNIIIISSRRQMSLYQML